MVETQSQRLPGGETWFVDIGPTSSTIQAPSCVERRCEGQLREPRTLG